MCIGLVWKGYDKLIDGFYLYRTTPPPDIRALTYPSAPLLSNEITEALAQPFYYLASGSQSFAFLSADQRYVLKLFKHYRWKSPFYFSWYPHITRPWTQKRLDGLIATYQSCLFCMHEFKEETALLYLQLAPSQGVHQTLTLYNRLGKKYTLPLETTSFIVQRYAEPVAQHLLKLKAQGQHDVAKECIHALFQHVLRKRLQGFTDKDPNFLNNFGFVEGCAVSIDVGGLIKDPKKDITYFCNRELKKVSKTLMPWLKNHYPELAEYTSTLITELKYTLGASYD